MWCLRAVAALAALFTIVSSLPYESDQVEWNLNQNQTATNVLDYWGQVRLLSLYTHVLATNQDLRGSGQTIVSQTHFTI